MTCVPVISQVGERSLAGLGPNNTGDAVWHRCRKHCPFPRANPRKRKSIEKSAKASVPLRSNAPRPSSILGDWTSSENTKPVKRDADDWSGPAVHTPEKSPPRARTRGGRTTYLRLRTVFTADDEQAASPPEPAAPALPARGRPNRWREQRGGSRRRTHAARY